MLYEQLINTAYEGNIHKLMSLHNINVGYIKINILTQLNINVLSKNDFSSLFNFIN